MVRKNRDMNGRRLFREYAQSRGKEATGFIEIKKERDYYDDNRSTFLITQDRKGNLEKTLLDFEEMMYWLIKTKKLV